MYICIYKYFSFCSPWGIYLVCLYLAPLVIGWGIIAWRKVSNIQLSDDEVKLHLDEKMPMHSLY